MLCCVGLSSSAEAAAASTEAEINPRVPETPATPPTYQSSRSAVATETESMNEPVRRNFLTYKPPCSVKHKHCRTSQSEDNSLVCTHCQHMLNVSGLSKNNSYSNYPHTAVSRTSKVPQFVFTEGFNE